MRFTIGIGSQPITIDGTEATYEKLKELFNKAEIDCIEFEEKDKSVTLIPLHKISYVNAKKRTGPW